MSSSSGLAYFFSSFPRLSEAFLQREVRDLREKGMEVTTFANRRPQRKDFDPQDSDFYADTFYLYPLRPLRVLLANLRLLRRRPAAYFKAVRQALRLHDGFAFQRLRNLARLAGAAVMAEQFLIRGISHLHVHFAFGAAGVALLLKTMIGISYSISIHGTDVLVPQPLIRQKLSQASFIISNCRHHIDFLQRKFPELAAQRFYHLPLGLNLSRGPWSAICDPAPLPPLRLLCVARFEPVKNHGLLLNALAVLKHKGIAFECRLAGDGSTLKAMRLLAASLQLHDSVSFLGPIGESAVADQMSWAHVIVLSSQSEGTPMTLIEAMAKARPVVAPNITGIPELVRHGETGWLYPCGEQTELADYLEKLAREPNVIPIFGRQGRQRAVEQFDISGRTDRLVKIFEQELDNE